MLFYLTLYFDVLQGEGVLKTLPVITVQVISTAEEFDFIFFKFQNLSKTWLCLDGPLHMGWADNFNSVLDNDKVNS